MGAKLASRELRGTVKAALEIAEHRARSLIPQGEEPHKTYRGRLVSPGYAVSTLHIEMRLDKRTGSAVASLGVGREAFYAVSFVELGTSFQAARPWLRPAFEDSQDAMLKEIGAQMKARIDKIARRKSATRRK